MRSDYSMINDSIPSPDSEVAVQIKQKWGSVAYKLLIAQHTGQALTALLDSMG